MANVELMGLAFIDTLMPDPTLSKGNTPDLSGVKDPSFNTYLYIGLGVVAVGAVAAVVYKKRKKRGRK